MKQLVVFGYGANGRQIAKKLSYGRRLLIVDSNQNLIDKAKKDGFDDAVCINLQSDRAIAQLGLQTKGYETLICSLDDEGMNIFLVISLKDMYPNIQTVAISDSIEMNQKLAIAGADKVIDIYESSSNRIYNIFEKPYVMQVFDILFQPNSKISFQEFAISDHPFFVDKKIDMLDFNHYGLILIGIMETDIKHHFTFITHDYDHTLKKGDVLVCMGKDKNLHHFKQIIKDRT